MSAFLIYSQALRSSMKSLYPNTKNNDLSTILAAHWRSASPEEKQPYLTKEMEDRERYHTEMSRWKAEHASSSDTDYSQDSIFLEVDPQQDQSRGWDNFWDYLDQSVLMDSSFSSSQSHFSSSAF